MTIDQDATVDTRSPLDRARDAAVRWECELAAAEAAMDLLDGGPATPDETLAERIRRHYGMWGSRR